MVRSVTRGSRLQRRAEMNTRLFVQSFQNQGANYQVIQQTQAVESPTTLPYHDSVARDSTSMQPYFASCARAMHWRPAVLDRTRLGHAEQLFPCVYEGSLYRRSVP